MLIVLRALQDLGGLNRKQEVLGYIDSQKWYAITQDDLVPYDSSNSLEPRYHTQLAWARKNSVLAGYMFDGGWDEWGITRSGREALERITRHFEARKHICVESCYLWTEVLKRRFDSNYAPGDDAKRPLTTSQMLDLLLSTCK